MMRLAAVVLTWNEERHLGRCLSSIRELADDIFVVDCHSTDDTLSIASDFEAHILQRPWSNHADQFNWALTQIHTAPDWILRIDADEYLTPELQEQLRSKLPLMHSDINGLYLNRRMTFQGDTVRYGGLFPVKVMRVFRYGRGRCETRWMDEHIKIDGATAILDGELIDDNLHSLTWWTEKHNRYASLEALETLNYKYRFLERDSITDAQSRSQAGAKRWIKERLYFGLPGGVRALAYFLYRYVIRLGFLDRAGGRRFHVLQGFWYRYLVDAKVAEVERYMQESTCDVQAAIAAVLDIQVDAR